MRCEVNACQFCEELASGESSVLTPPRRRVVYQDDTFTAVAAIGSFVPGYLLLLPAQHFQSFASLGESAFLDALRVIQSLRDRMYPIFGEAVLFEHGSHGTQPGGACLDHAHLHLVPCRRPARLLDGLPDSIRLRRTSDLLEYSQQPYLFAQDSGQAGVVIPNPQVRSQYLRRRLAEVLDVTERWDWAAYLGLEEMATTLSSLGVVARSTEDGE